MGKANFNDDFTCDAVRQVTEGRDILKKGNRVLRQGCKVRNAFVVEHRPLFSVRAISSPLRLVDAWRAT